MILTLGMLLSSKERKMSRLVWQSEDAALYEPDLFLQGLILVNVCVMENMYCLLILIGATCILELCKHYLKSRIKD